MVSEGCCRRPDGGPEERLPPTKSVRRGGPEERLPPTKSVQRSGCDERLPPTKHEALHALHVRQAKPPRKQSVFLPARSSKSGRVQPTMDSEEPLLPTKAVRKGGCDERRLLPAFSVVLPVRSSMKGGCVLQPQGSSVLRPSTKMRGVTRPKLRGRCADTITPRLSHSPTSTVQGGTESTYRY